MNGDLTKRAFDAVLVIAAIAYAVMLLLILAGKME